MRVICILCSLFCFAGISMSQPSSTSKPLPVGVAAAWRKAGAVEGWMVVEYEGQYRPFYSGKQAAAKRSVPGFLLIFKHIKSTQLPAPAQPFGLSISLASAKESDLRFLLGFTNLCALDVGDNDLTDEHAKTIAMLPNLENLTICGNSISDTGVQELTKLKRLRVLDLSYTKITDRACSHLIVLDQLVALNLYRTSFSQTGAIDIAKMKHLQTLDISNTQATDKAVEELAVLTELRNVSLGWNENIGDASIKAIASCPKLEILDLYKTSVTNGGMKVIVKSL